MDERVRRVDEPLQPLRLRMVDIRAALLDEYLELKEKLGPLEKRLEDVRDRLRDLVTEEGHFVDEVRAVIVRVEPRFRKSTMPRSCRPLSPAWVRACDPRWTSPSWKPACEPAWSPTANSSERACSQEPFTHVPWSSKPLVSRIFEGPDVRSRLRE